jgi:hypothetical protein
MEKERSTMWISAVVLVVVIAGVLFMVLNKKDATDVVVEDTTAAPVVNDGASTDEPKESVQDTTGVKTGASAVSISYANALVKYADRRIQLDKTCQAIPNVVTYKDNTGIMFDNRSAETRTVKVDQVYTIKPYGFRIVVLPDIYLKSKTVLVDCDKSQNVATILIQE